MPGLILEIVEGEGAGRQLPLSGALELGRDPSLSGALDDGQVSRRHARVTPTADGATVEDLGSTNGTYLNDQPVRGALRLSSGDRIRVGLTVLELRTETQVAAQPSAVQQGPPVTQLGADVLRPAGERELAPVREDVANVPNLLTDEDEPAFIQRSAVGAALGEAGPADGGGAGSDADSLARLVDTRVKRQTSIAAFAIPAIAGLALLIFFGVR